ncbi:MAG: sigma-70 family RNA polymerase sigma factor [Gemmatimonadales bacterium]|nr:MAG: sigma-70 family RNA polymerase sigma factor [Gemmatimonadales bacterium]
MADSTPPAPGDADRIAFNELFAALYPDLRRIALRHLRRERTDHTLSPTSLVHEAYLKLEHRAEIPWHDRQRFLAFISRAMRRILVDHARQRASFKRGGGNHPVTLQTGSVIVHPRSTDLLALDEALARLGERDPRLERVVECRFFGGLSSAETAEALGVSLRTAERDWMRARAYLHELLEERPD